MSTASPNVDIPELTPRGCAGCGCGGCLNNPEGKRARDLMRDSSLNEVLAALKEGGIPVGIGLGGQILNILCGLAKYATDEERDVFREQLDH